MARKSKLQKGAESGPLSTASKSQQPAAEAVQSNKTKTSDKHAAAVMAFIKG